MFDTHADVTDMTIDCIRADEVKPGDMLYDHLGKFHLVVAARQEEYHNATRIFISYLKCGVVVEIKLIPVVYLHIRRMNIEP
jgi:hypothetical protein